MTHAQRGPAKAWLTCGMYGSLMHESSFCFTRHISTNLGQFWLLGHLPKFFCKNVDIDHVGATSIIKTKEENHKKHIRTNGRANKDGRHPSGAPRGEVSNQAIAQLFFFVFTQSRITHGCHFTNLRKKKRFNDFHDVFFASFYSSLMYACERVKKFYMST